MVINVTHRNTEFPDIVRFLPRDFDDCAIKFMLGFFKVKKN